MSGATRFFSLKICILSLIVLYLHAKKEQMKTGLRNISPLALKNHPENPRKISRKELKKLCDSIEANPLYFEARPIIADTELLVWAGNSRLKAAKELKLETVPVYVMDLPEPKLRKIMIRDNVNNGKWDELMLAEFDLHDLSDWGLSVQGIEYDFREVQVEEKSTIKKNKTKKVVTCPRCGEDFEL